MLHNIGRFIGHGSHHKHSYYLIRHAEQLAGFNEHERELMAQIARYHRKSAPKQSHREFGSLGVADQQIVRSLAGMLRVGIALDRSYQRRVTAVTVEPFLTGLMVTLEGARNKLDLELFSARSQVQLLEESLGRAITFTVAS